MLDLIMPIASFVAVGAFGFLAWLTVVQPMLAGMVPKSWIQWVEDADA